MVPNLLKCYFKYITLCDAGQSHSPWRIQRGVMGSCPLFYKLKYPNITCDKLPKKQYLTIENFTQIWLGGQRNFHLHPPPTPHTHTFFKFWIRPLNYSSSTLVIKGGSRIWKMCIWISILTKMEHHKHITLNTN